jgi:hypothetical protein
MVSPLPHELIVHIISYIGGDRDPDLRACGLVCHAWAEPARRALFRTVHLQSESFSPDARAALLGLLDRTPAVAGYIREICWDLEMCHHLNDPVAHALLDRISTITVEHNIEHRVRIDLKHWGKSFAVVLDKAPAIAPFVRDVEWFFDDGYPALWTHSLIGGLDLARRLRHVRKLALFQVGTLPFRATAPFGKLSDALASVPVTQLCLNSVVFSTTAEYASFVSSFLGLQDLHLSDVEIDDKEHLDYTASVPSSLRSFVLGPTQSKLALLSYLVGDSTSRPLGLKYLSATFGLDALGAVGSRLLQACEATLTTLSLHGARTIRSRENSTDASFRSARRGRRPFLLPCSYRSQTGRQAPSQHQRCAGPRPKREAQVTADRSQHREGRGLGETGRGSDTDALRTS